MELLMWIQFQSNRFRVGKILKSLRIQKTRIVELLCPPKSTPCPKEVKCNLSKITDITNPSILLQKITSQKEFFVWVGIDGFVISLVFKVLTIDFFLTLFSHFSSSKNFRFVYFSSWKSPDWLQCPILLVVGKFPAWAFYHPTRSLGWSSSCPLCHLERYSTFCRPLRDSDCLSESTKEQVGTSKSSLPDSIRQRFYRFRSIF